MGKIGWPVSEDVVDLVIEIVLQRWSGQMVLMPIAKRRGIEPVIKKSPWDENRKIKDYENPVMESLKTADYAEKMRFLVEILVEVACSEEKREKVAKALLK